MDAATLLPAALAAADPAPPADPPGPDRYCGPRAVATVLDHYRGPAEPYADLIEIIREVQPPGVRDDSSLADLAACLRRRGLFTFAVTIPPARPLPGDGPAILHLKAASADSAGHFAVWRRGTDGRPDALDHGLRSEAVTPEALAARRTGPVLLISDAAVPRPPAVSPHASPAWTANQLLLFAAAFFVGGGGVLLLRPTARRPSAESSPPESRS